MPPTTDSVRRARARPDGSGTKLLRWSSSTRGTGQAEPELGPFKPWGAAGRRGRADAIPGDEHDPRRRLPSGALNYWLSSFTRGLPDELIEVAVERFATVPSPMTFDPARALPRRRDARRPDRDGGAPPRARLEPPPPLRLDRTRPGATRTSPGGREASRRCGRISGAGGGSTTWATTRSTTSIRAAYGPNYDRLARGQAPLRPGQRLPPQPQHRALARPAEASDAPDAEHVGGAARQVDRPRSPPETGCRIRHWFACGRSAQRREPDGILFGGSPARVKRTHRRPHCPPPG